MRTFASFALIVALTGATAAEPPSKAPGAAGVTGYNSVPQQQVTGSNPVPQTQPALRAEVDPRVELLSIIFRFAGNREYNMPNSKSPYSERVEKHFGPQREHAVVKLARELRNEHGVSYDAVMSMAVHLTDATALAERIPFDTPPARLDQRWQTKDAREFLEQARAFVREAQFAEFVAAEQPFYDRVAARMNAALQDMRLLPWFDGFFSRRSQAEFRVVAGLLNGGSCYGVGVRYPDGREEIVPVIGMWTWDKKGVPRMPEGVESTIAHELCHSYTNEIVDRFADQLLPAGKRLFARRAGQMQRQAYGEPKTLLYESLVRACCVRYDSARGGKSAARKAIKEEHGRGFTWTGELAALLAEYEADREQYPKLGDFMPRVVTFFEAQAEKVDGEAAKDAPKVVKMVPANGAEDVDPNLTAVVVTFDRPMMDQTWAVVRGELQYPETPGKPSYDADCKVFTLPVKLEPGRTYGFWLNRDEYQAFMSAEGVPLESVAVQFTTRR